MGPIAKAVTQAIAVDDDAWFWWAECERVSTIHRRQAWPTNWSDDAAMRIPVRYPVSIAARRVQVLTEAE